MGRNRSNFQSRLNDNLANHPPKLIMNAISSGNFEELLKYEEFNVYELYNTFFEPKLVKKKSNNYGQFQYLADSNYDEKEYRSVGKKPQRYLCLFFENCSNKEIINHFVRRAKFFDDIIFQGKPFIYHAIKNFYYDTFVYFVCKNPKLDWDKFYDENLKLKRPILYCIELGNLSKFKLLIRKDKISLESPYDLVRGKRLVHEICSTFIYRFIKYLKPIVEMGANLNEPCLDKGIQPIHYVCKYYDPKKVDYLVKNGANPNSKDRKGRKPIHYACKYNLYEIVRYLVYGFVNYSYDKYNKNLKIRSKVDLYEADNKGFTPLKYASESNKILIFIKKQMEIDLRTIYSRYVTIGTSFTTNQIYQCDIDFITN